MKNLNRFFSALITAVLILSLAGCGQTEEKPVITTESGIAYEIKDDVSEDTSAESETEVTTEKSTDSISDRNTISERKASASDEDSLSSDIQASSETSEIPAVPEIEDTEPESETESETSLETVSSDEFSEPDITVTTVPEDTESSDTEESSEETVPTPAPKTEKTPAPKNSNGSYSEFFSNSLFVGDSICSGLKVYGGLLDSQHVAARPNVATRNIGNYTFQYINNSTKEMHAVDIVEYYQPDDIFIWMGMNDLLCINDEKYGNNMKSLAEEYLKVSPGSRVHIVSMSPMTSTHKWNLEYNGNAKINDYNRRLQYVCDHTDYMDYININEFLKNESGYLASDYDGGDGIHLSPAAYKIVLNQICKYMTEEVYAEETEPDDTEISADEGTVSDEETEITEATEAPETEEFPETPEVSVTPEETEPSSEEKDEETTEKTKSKAEEFKEFFFGLKNK